MPVETGGRAPRWPAVELARIVPFAVRISIRRMSSCAVNVLSLASRSRALDALIPAASRSARCTLLFTKSATRERSRDTTAASVALERCMELTVTRAVAVTPMSTRKTPNTSASSIGRGRARIAAAVAFAVCACNMSPGP